MADLPPTKEQLMPEPITLSPDVDGNVRCPLCHRTCALPYFVGQHVDHHRFTIEGKPLAEIEVAVLVIVHDRYQFREPTDG
jgi:hypothetical protein